MKDPKDPKETKDPKTTKPAARRSGRPRRGSCFESESAYRRRLDAYVAYCREKGRVPNLPGFCSFCRIRREDYAALRERFPLQYDIAESTFLDEALNTKAANTGSMMEFLMALCGRQEDAGGTLTVLCDHDIQEDGG